MENRPLSELTLEEIIKAAGGTLDANDELSMNLMIKLFKAQGRKNGRDLPDPRPARRAKRVYPPQLVQGINQSLPPHRSAALRWGFFHVVP